MTDQNLTSILQRLATETGLPIAQIQAAINLLDAGATIPFIARYRKEATGSLNEVQIAAIRDGKERLEALADRREAILYSIEQQGKLNPALEAQINAATTLAELEDLYLPYRPKRRTRATMAIERGLETLANAIFEQQQNNIETLAQQFIDPEKGVPDVKTAIAGACDILAERMNEDAPVRAKLRNLFMRKGEIISIIHPDKAETPEAATYKDYFNWREPAARIPSHRLLAILRGTAEDFLRLTITPDDADVENILDRHFIRKPNHPSANYLKITLRDAWKRLLHPSLENEVRSELKQKADKDAINVFAANLRELLLTPPLGEHAVMGIDPGYRTGCKLVCLNKQGDLLYNTTIFPHDKSSMRRYEATDAIENLCRTYQITAIAIGNGTAGRETFQFVKQLQLPQIEVVMVNEAGASIYSASEIAREEFPDYDLTVRGAISIGRRLIDPLAELVKIDPKSIGVGQYQHDVNQAELKKSLDDTVISCVNLVGVEVNTASAALLTYVSGVGPKLAQNIVAYRTETGNFKRRQDLQKVKGLGPKAYEQCAGFLRIRNGENPLDASAVHPESYPIVLQMAKDANCSVEALIQQPTLRQNIQLKNYITATVGMPTLADIMDELAKPGRDPRQQFENVQFDDNISSIDDLHEGMVLNGIVTNVTNFGAFIDIGVKDNGLIHISEMADRFVSDPHKVLKVHQKVKVRVISIDTNRKRINLSMRGI